MSSLLATDLGRHHLDAAIAALPDPETADALIARYIRPDSLRRGRHAAKVDAGYSAVSVWALIGHMRGGGGTRQAAADYDLPEEAVVAAVAFYAKHRPFIDARLVINEDYFDDWDAPEGGSKSAKPTSLWTRTSRRRSNPPWGGSSTTS